ncbi:MAG: Fmu (Sun) domain-containing protein [Thermoprotei archaeon]|nr:MAG: Fmu (Sun) domain-containing protein [Thermoprotei archaeon]
MSYLTLTPKDLEALVMAVKLAEEVKPSQQAKRDVFSKYGIAGSYKDRVLTAIFYDLHKRMGIIDRIICELTGVSNTAILDPWLRAALRVAVELLVFERHVKDEVSLKDLLVKYFKSRIAKFLSDSTHPYVSMYFWDLVDKIRDYRYEAKDLISRWEYRYLISRTIIERMIKLIGKEETRKLLKAFNRIPMINVRVNILKATVEEVEKKLLEEGVKPARGKYVPTVLKFEGPYDFDKSELFQEGKIIIQDEAAAAASILLDPKPGEVVVDMAAAPGGKTEHMGELMKNSGVIHAFDIDKFRVRRMKELLRRAGITIVKIHLEDSRRAPEILGEEIADKVLLDAPCTSSGTIMKNHELRWRIMEKKILEMSKLQLEMLEAGFKLLKPGGMLLYTTCSLFREENEDVIEKFLRRYANARLIELKGPFDLGFIPGTMRAWPHRHGTLGFFYALIERKT